jgi:ABC-type multidrug transport system fused ATPase/permease subunit
MSTRSWSGPWVFSGTARAGVLGGLFGAAGWLLFAAAFVAGIAVVVVRAAHGTASVGAVVLAVTLVQRAQLQVGQAAAAIGQLLTTARTARRLLWLLWLEDYAAADRAGGPVSHRFSTVRMADLIIVLDQGRIAATGDHASLIRAGGLYAELYELQARAYR